MGFLVHTVSVAATQPCCYSMKVAIDSMLLRFNKIDVEIWILYNFHDYSFHFKNSQPLKNVNSLLRSWVCENMLWARFGCWAGFDSWVIICCFLVKSRGSGVRFPKFEFWLHHCSLDVWCWTIYLICFCCCFLNCKIGLMLIFASCCSCENQMRRMPGSEAGCIKC